MSVTAQQVIDKVKEIAEADPEHIYTNPERKTEWDSSCLYVHHRGTDKAEAGCIFGRAFAAVGIEIPAEHEGSNAPAVMNAILEGGLTHDQTVWCIGVQSAQDGGEAWGDAVVAGYRAVFSEAERVRNRQKQH